MSILFFKENIRFGHKQIDCRQGTKTNESVPGPSGIKTNVMTEQISVKKCTYCQNPGHTEDVCYRKYGGSK